VSLQITSRRTGLTPGIATISSAFCLITQTTSKWPPPYIAQIAGAPSGVLKGKAAVAAYWAKALEHVPTLHFELHSTLVGAESVVIYYQGVRGMAAELFFFDAHGKIAKACAHYA